MRYTLTYTKRPGRARHRKLHGLDDLALHEPAGMGGILHAVALRLNHIDRGRSLSLK